MNARDTNAVHYL